MPALCIDFGGSVIKLGLLEGSKSISTRSLATTGTERDLTNVWTAASEMIEMLPATAKRVEGIGIAVPGVVDKHRGCLVAAHDKYGYATGMDLRSWAEEQFGAPAAIENDARAALIGEVTHGCAVGARDVVLIVLGTGIGTAALVDGTLLRGAHDHGGILGGHISVDLEGPECNCGNVGCAEAIASTWTLERTVRSHRRLADSPWWRERLDRGPLELKDLFEHLDDPVSADVLDRFVRTWGAAVVGLCHAYDPSVVVVSGGVMRSSAAVLPALAGYVAGHLWSSSHRPDFVTPPAPEHSVLLGLGVLAVQAAHERTSVDER